LKVENNLMKQMIDFMQEESKIERYKNDIKDLPLWLKYVGVGATVFGTIFGGWGIYIILNQPVPSQTILNNPTSENATSTINISDLLSKALALDTVIERQDFLTKYVGDLVYGKGEIKQVSRYGNKLLVDFDINNQIIICPQDEDTRSEKQLLLLKGKTASFSGIFTYTEYFNYKGLVIDNCILQR